MAEVPNIVPALPELFLGLSIMAMLMFGVFQKTGDAGDEVKTSRMISLLSIITLILALLLVSALTGPRLLTDACMMSRNGAG